MREREEEGVGGGARDGVGGLRERGSDDGWW